MLRIFSEGLIILQFLSRTAVFLLILEQFHLFDYWPRLRKNLCRSLRTLHKYASQLPLIEICCAACLLTKHFFFVRRNRHSYALIKHQYRFLIGSP